MDPSVLAEETSGAEEAAEVRETPVGGVAREPEIFVHEVQARAYTIPTDAPEADGTLSWKATSVVVARVRAGLEVGLGYSYAAPAAAALIADTLADVVRGADALSPPAAWERMRAAVRNLGRPGIASCAIAALDVALWDLKARLLGLSLASLLGRVRERVPIYGSGGFTSYNDEQLERQLAGWSEQGITRMKIKVGSDPRDDPRRVRLARRTVGDDAELFVDANGAYERKQALSLAETFVQQAGVSWFEEPVSSDDLDGLRLLRDRVPAPMAITAGEYGYDLFYFRRMLEAGAVDVLQADVTRCGGVTELLRVGALCAAAGVPLSAHTSPAIHAHVCAAIAPVVHVEYFHDHARIEELLFDGTLQPRDGTLEPDRGRPGLGLELRESDVERYAV
jgi:L-alanine-DL-glutamate epimerase-like enolase superfamily enzyme